METLSVIQRAGVNLVLLLKLKVGVMRWKVIFVMIIAVRILVITMILG